MDYLKNLRASLDKVTLFRRKKNSDRQYIETDFLSGIEGVLAARLTLSAWFIPLALVILVIVLIIWAWVSEVDVVSPSTGEIVTSQEVQLIQSKEVGIVKAIRAKNGDQVSKGQLLVELEDRDLQGQLSESKEQLRQFAIELLVLSWQKKCFEVKEDCLKMSLTVDWIQSLLSDQANVVRRYSSQANRMSKTLFRERWRHFLTQKQLRENQVSVLQTQLEQKASEIRYAQELLPIYQKRLERMMALDKENLTAGSKVEEAQEALLSQQQQLSSAQLEQQNLLAQHRVSRSELNSYVYQSKVQVGDDWFSKLSEFRAKVSAEQRLLRLLAEKRIVSPVDGTVFGRTIATVGGVVQSAEVLMKILPVGTVLQAKINVLNKDRGFISVGDAVAVKVDAYPFTKHGSIQGEVANISSSAILDEQLGAVYPTVVKFTNMNVKVLNQPAPIIPGMTVVADLYQGKRLLAEYVLAPLLKHKQESLRER